MSDQLPWESWPFEKAMERLEEVVRSLENGDVPLEEAIHLFDEGMKIAYVCNKKLERAEKQIEMLVEENGEWIKKPFTSREESE
jgi:exodeoxyribonuclease VII small subunit